ncbi:MAG: hypothetical protein E6I32_00190 [Chloroflexi bacterium]|nr:MAG: hypothetical protein E6I32_00190 [Chloroflexota bacterium]
MAIRATFVSKDPLNYFLQHDDEGPHLRVSDVVLRVNHDPKEIFSHLIRIATNSQWSHSALLYLTNDPPKGFDNTFLVEAMTAGIRVASWRNEVVPFEQFTVGIKRPRIDWYVETPRDIAKHDPDDPEDVHGIAYLRHVRGIALDQINGLYDHNTVHELTALYIERVAKRHLPGIPQVAEAAAGAADLFKKWDEDSSRSNNIVRFICGGLVQYSFFAALRIRILNDLAVPQFRDAAMSNLSNLHRVIYRDDPEGVIQTYVQQLQSGKLKLSDPIPDDVLDLLKTAIPADFNNSPDLAWRYVVKEGMVWQLDEVPDGYTPASKDEADVLQLIQPEHR